MNLSSDRILNVDGVYVSAYLTIIPIMYSDFNISDTKSQNLVVCLEIADCMSITKVITGTFDAAVCKVYVTLYCKMH